MPPPSRSGSRSEPTRLAATDLSTQEAARRDLPFVRLVIARVADDSNRELLTDIYNVRAIQVTLAIAAWERVLDSEPELHLFAADQIIALHAVLDQGGFYLADDDDFQAVLDEQGRQAKIEAARHALEGTRPDTPHLDRLLAIVAQTGTAATTPTARSSCVGGTPRRSRRLRRSRSASGDNSGGEPEPPSSPPRERGRS